MPQTVDLSEDKFQLSVAPGFWVSSSDAHLHVEGMQKVFLLDLELEVLPLVGLAHLVFVVVCPELCAQHGAVLQALVFEGLALLRRDFHECYLVFWRTQSPPDRSL